MGENTHSVPYKWFLISRSGEMLEDGKTGCGHLDSCFDIALVIFVCSNVNLCFGLTLQGLLVILCGCVFNYTGVFLSLSTLSMCSDLLIYVHLAIHGG